MSSRSLTSLRKEAKQRGIVIPKPATFAKYGWDERSWLAMLDDQGWHCPICEREPKTGRYVTDHEHVRGWAKMDDANRRLYVRGITCWSCNRYLLARDISVTVARNVVSYLEKYSARRP